MVHPHQSLLDLTSPQKALFYPIFLHKDHDISFSFGFFIFGRHRGIHVLVQMLRKSQHNSPFVVEFWLLDVSASFRIRHRLSASGASPPFAELVFLIFLQLLLLVRALLAKMNSALYKALLRPKRGDLASLNRHVSYIS